MYEIDKARFGAFLSQLRREQGLTQKELAAKVFVSDKAVSKWETGVSIPDVSVLLPLADALGVSVTELLEYRRLPREEPLQSQQVEQLLQKAISCSEDPNPRPGLKRRVWVYLLFLAIAGAEVAALHFLGHPFGTFPATVQLGILFGVIFGAWFMLVVSYRLPEYYDQNRIGYVYQNGLKMQLPGVSFNNRNWPHVVKVGQVWSMASLVSYPAIYGLCLLAVPEAFLEASQMVLLAILLGSLFVPLYLVARKYEK